ncbi:hypothetical protein [Bradyrhizobium sp. OAE829]|uniref:hypothetical protein n=1 Tax=Bradyrhizobium sp. OAE829 TaxID=2663807 RepID=UPI0017895D9B
MTIRRFNHVFLPSSQGTGSLPIIELTTTEIAHAAIREIVQISLSAAPFDLFVDQLLVPSDAWFRWVSPLGQIRETKTALSGLFGRFVARAYLARYCQFRYFEPIRSDTQTLSGWPSFTVKRVDSGDLPDWIVATAGGANSIAIAEAKGSHNTSGYSAPLSAAKTQARRIVIKSGTTTLAVKRYAIVSRWSVQGIPNLNMPWLAVDDPEEGERPPSPDERKLLARSIALGHFAAMAEGLGATAISMALHQAKQGSPGSLQLPEQELVQVEREDASARIVLGAAVTNSGIIPLPRYGELEEFRSSLQTVFGGKVMLLTIDGATLKQIDAGTFPTEAEQPKEPVGEPSFWTEERQHFDGTELIPMSLVSLSRPPTADQLGG